MTRSTARRLLQILGCAVAGWLLIAAPAVAAPSEMSIDVSGISSPVGMAADTDGNCYWVTDGRPATTRTLIAVDSSGRRSKTVSWKATTTDVQALAWAKGNLYVGDIGDPKATRDHIQVLSPNSLSGSSASWRAWDMVYPDGARDAAAMAVSAKGNIYIISRGSSPAIYRAPSTLSRDGDNTLIKAASAPSGVTDAVFTPDGQKLVLRTANTLTVLDAYTWKTLSTATISPAGGQAIASDLAGKGLLLSGSSTAVQAMDMPAPGARATPAASSSAAHATGANSSKSTANSRSGTLFTLIGAGVLALLAAVIVYRAR